MDLAIQLDDYSEQPASADSCIGAVCVFMGPNEIANFAQWELGKGMASRLYHLRLPIFRQVASRRAKLAPSLQVREALIRLRI